MKFDSIEHYIQNTKYDILFNAINEYYNENKNHMYLTSYTVPYPNSIKVKELSVLKVYFKDDVYNDIDEFKIILEVDFQLVGTDRNDIKKRSFIATCSGLINEGLEQFNIIKIDKYIRRPYLDNGLSEFLIPYLNKDNLEQRAEMFLEKYYKEALVTPMALPISEILKKMEVTVHHAPLGKNILGKTIFINSLEKIYNDDNMIEEIELNPRTILIDPHVAFFRNIGTYNNTIIHECVHIELHSKYFEMQKILNNPAKSIVSRVGKGRKNLNSKELRAYGLMEWQASVLAPRILMPEKTTRIMYNKLTQEVDKYYSNYSKADKLEIVVEKIADFFKVSKLASKIRLIQLGYKEVIGIGNYVNGDKVPNFSFSDNYVVEDKTHVIDFVDSIKLIEGNEDLKKLSLEGKITYVNGFVVINNPEYVNITDSGEKTLTAYALENIDKCAFTFKRKKTKTNSNYYDHMESLYFLCRPDNKKNYVEADFDEESTNNKKLIQYGYDLSDTLSSLTLLKKMNGEFHEDFKLVLEELGYTKKDGTPNYYQISKLTQLSDHTIKSYLEGRTKPQKEKLMAICGGLCIHTRIAYKLFEKAGITILNSMNEEDLIYCGLIERHYDEGLETWNNYLRKANKTMLP